jgi:methylenetetrahydrofolate reductase (NADPH)
MLIRDRLATGEPSISFEFFPPKSDEAAAQLERTIAELSVLKPDFVSVTYGAGGSTREKTIEIVSRIREHAGIEAMAHLTCVGATAGEIGAVVDRLVVAGVANILALRGDPPKGETSFTTVEGGFAHASELAGHIRGRYGQSLSVGGAAYPEKHAECTDAATDLQNLKRKVNAGVDFLITQLFYDNRCYWEFCERARAEGISVPIIPGIMPITNAAQPGRFGASVPPQLARALQDCGADPRAVMQLGVRHATEQCIDLLRGGAPGVHFYTLNRSTAARDVFAGLRAAGVA